MLMIQKHFHNGGTGVTNFDIEDIQNYQEAIALYGSDALEIGPPIYPIHDDPNTLALHINKHRHPNDLSTFWAIFDSIAYNIIEHPWMIDYQRHKIFNEYQMKQNGFTRIN